MGTNRRLSAMSGIDKVEGGNGSPELPYPSMLSEGLRRIIEQSKISQSVCIFLSFFFSLFSFFFFFLFLFLKIFEKYSEKFSPTLCK